MPSFLAFPRIGRGVARTPATPRPSARAPTGAAEDASSSWPRPSGMVGKKSCSAGCRPRAADRWRRSRRSRMATRSCAASRKRGRWRTTRSNRGSRSAWRRQAEADSKENFELVKAVFASIGLPPEALDVRGVRASAFKPCYNLLVVCFFLRNLALHGDFSVDFTHQIDATLTQFLQSPASVESLRRGGAPPRPGRAGAGKKPRKKAEQRRRPPRRRASSAPDAASALRLLGEALETATAASPYGGIENGGIEPSEPARRYLRAVPEAPPKRGLAYRGGERALRRVRAGRRVPTPSSAPVAAPRRARAAAAPRCASPRDPRSVHGAPPTLRLRLARALFAADEAPEGYDRRSASRGRTTRWTRTTRKVPRRPRRSKRPRLSDTVIDLDSRSPLDADALASARFEAEGLRRVPAARRAIS